MKQTLTEIFNEIGNHSGKDIGCNDKGGLHTYLETYDRLFAPFQTGGAILEIGLALGDSIKLWDRYFDGGRIVGVDISVVFTTPVSTKNIIEIIQADATSGEMLEKFEDEEFDIIIDDSSHLEQDQIATFELLKSKVKRGKQTGGFKSGGGLYIIEDILAIDQNKHKFKALHDNCEIIDMRKINGRFDNVLIIYRF
jgi:23S rRNA U2552 (ribose-2'-O)-methylase RlmE/FtsJ